MIINRYIFKEMLGPFVLGLFVFTFIFLLNKIIRLTELIIGKGVSLTEVLSLIGYILPSFLVLVIPSTVLLASLLGFGRLCADGEITALNASGVSFYKMIIPVMGFSFLCYLTTSFLMINILPRANLSFKRMLYEIARTRALVNIKEREFIDDFKGMVIYVDQVSAENRLKGIIISDKRSLPEPYIIMAHEGRITANPDNLMVSIHLQGGSIQSLSQDNRFRQIDFEEYQLNLDLASFLNQKKLKKREREMTIAELRAAINRKKEKQQSYSHLSVELHKKFAIPFAALILGLVGAPLGINSRTSSRAAGFALSILIIFGYYILLRTGESLGDAGKFPPAICMWIPNLLLCLVGGYLVYKTGRNSRIKWVDWLTETIGKAAREIRSHLSR
jgi:lipopolysaccharide export system permease protein